MGLIQQSKAVAKIIYTAFGIFSTKLRSINLESNFWNHQFFQKKEQKTLKNYPKSFQDIFSRVSFVFGRIENSKIFSRFTDLYQHLFWFNESLLHVFHYSTIISTKNISTSCVRLMESCQIETISLLKNVLGCFQKKKARLEPMQCLKDSFLSFFLICS